MNQLLLHIRRILFAFQIDLRPQQHRWWEETGAPGSVNSLENSQANKNSRRHNRNYVSQSQGDVEEPTTVVGDVCSWPPGSWSSLDQRRSTWAALVRWSRSRWRWTTTKWWGWDWRGNLKEDKRKERKSRWSTQGSSWQLRWRGWRRCNVLPLLQSCHCWHQVSSKSIMRWPSRQSKIGWFRLVGEADCSLGQNLAMQNWYRKCVNRKINEKYSCSEVMLSVWSSFFVFELVCV